MKKLKINKKVLMEEGRRNLCAIIAAVIFALNIKTFVNAAGLFPGGFTGITLLIQKICTNFFQITISYSLINYSLNIIPIIIGFKKIGKRFTVSSCIVILLTGLLADLIPAFPITYDILLISIFGGLVNGFAVGLCLIGGTSSGGTDFIALYCAERFKIEPWYYVFGFNSLILIVAGALFGWDIALYSILFQFTSTQVVNLLHRQYKKVTLFIITNKPDEVFMRITQETHHSATKFHAVGCYEQEDRDMIYSVVSSTQMRSLTKLIKEVDEHAFINVVKTEYLDGRFREMTYY
ncbi:MAG: YitT family protein [Lachnospiraceae bacterium]